LEQFNHEIATNKLATIEISEWNELQQEKRELQRKLAESNTKLAESNTKLAESNAKMTAFEAECKVRNFVLFF
jgi:hypothetical protein